MKRSYRLLALVVAVGSVLVALTARPRSAATVHPGAPAAADVAPQQVAIAIAEGRILPPRVAVAKGSRVTVTAENRDAAIRELTLLGYEREVVPIRILPGHTETLRFTAERPGSDFAWLVDGRPAGRFDVAGSHLVEGHR